VHNSAGRALFPKLCRQRAVNIRPLVGLLQHKHPLCQNKAAGIMAVLRLTPSQRRYIGKQHGKLLYALALGGRPHYVRRASTALALALAGVAVYKEID